MLGVLHYEHTHTHTHAHTHTHTLSLSLSHTHTHTHTNSLSLSLHPTSTPPRSFGEVLFWCSLGHETKGLLRCGQDVEIQQLTKRSFSPFFFSVRRRCHGFQTPVLDVRVHFTQPILKRRFSDCSVSGCGGGRTRPMLFTLSRLSTWSPITYTGVSSPPLNCDAERIARPVAIKDQSSAKRYDNNNINNTRLCWP